MDWIGDAWREVTTAQPPASTTTVLVTAAAVLAVLLVPKLWHLTRHALTILHEAAHATVAVLCGRRLAGIRVHSDTSGLTVSVGKRTGFGMVATLAAGYVGPALVGLGSAWLTSRGCTVALLWALVVVLALVLLQIRNWYGLWSVLVSAAVVVAVTVWGSDGVQVVFALAVSWFLLLGAPRAVVELQAQRWRQRHRRAVGTSDADQLARLTHLPGLVWVGFFLLVCAGCLLLGGFWLLSG